MSAPPGTDEYVLARPSAPLRGLVAGYQGYRQAGLPPGRHRGLPSPYLTVIVTLDDPLEIAAHPDPRQPAGRYDSLVGGLHTAPVAITHPGRQSGIQVSLTPLGARRLLGMPAAELAGTDVHAAQVMPWLAPVRDRMRAPTGWRQRLRVLDAALRRRVRPESALPGDVANAWGRLLESAGTITVADLSAELGWTSRHLGARFHAEIGLGVKAAARVVRFDRARRLLQRTAGAAQHPTLADVAATCGYCDQAHLAREFGALAGCPPSRWLADEGPRIPAIET